MISLFWRKLTAVSVSSDRLGESGFSSSLDNSLMNFLLAYTNQNDRKRKANEKQKNGSLISLKSFQCRGLQTKYGGFVLVVFHVIDNPILSKLSFKESFLPKIAK